MAMCLNGSRTDSYESECRPLSGRDFVGGACQGQRPWTLRRLILCGFLFRLQFCNPRFQFLYFALQFRVLVLGLAQ